MNYRTYATLKEREHEDRQQVESFGALPVNVFTRLRNTQNLSMQQLADKALCSKLTILRTEQGTYNEPPPIVLDYWVTYHGFDRFSLGEEYRGYQEQIRSRNRLYFGPSLTVFTSDPTHPLRQLRSARHNLTLNEVSRALCIPQATLQYFERKWRTQKSVPKCLADVLVEIGYTVPRVLEFCDAYANWREFHK